MNNYGASVYVRGWVRVVVCALKETAITIRLFCTVC